jgi:hypothetical protein
MRPIYATAEVEDRQTNIRENAYSQFFTVRDDRFVNTDVHAKRVIEGPHELLEPQNGTSEPILGFANHDMESGECKTGEFHQKFRE